VGYRYIGSWFLLACWFPCVVVDGIPYISLDAEDKSHLNEAKSTFQAEPSIDFSARLHEARRGGRNDFG
jgi:hypothetical protein